MVLFALLPPFAAHILNKILVVLVAYTGMYLLTSRYILASRRSPLIEVGVALWFAMLPMFTITGLVNAGMPLVAFSALNMTHGRSRWSDYAVFVLFPLWSYLSHSGVFVLATLVGYGSRPTVPTRRLAQGFVQRHRDDDRSGLTHVVRGCRSPWQPHSSTQVRPVSDCAGRPLPAAQSTPPRDRKE